MEPTPEMSIDEQLAAMRAGTDYLIPVSIREFSIKLRPLTITESNEVASEVRAQLKAVPDEMQHTLKEHTIKAVETLYLASDRKLHKKLLGAMTNDELMNLFKQYSGICDKVNPMLEEMSAEQMKELITHLKKNGSSQEVRLALTELSYSELVSLLGHCLTTGD